MSDHNLRDEIHRLVDVADDSQLDAALEILKPSASIYSKEDIESFYKRSELFDKAVNKEYSIQESHNLIRKRFKNGL